MTDKQKEITEELFENAKKVTFGTVSVELKIHAGKCTGIIYTISKNNIEKKSGDNVFNDYSKEN